VKTAKSSTRRGGRSLAAARLGRERNPSIYGSEREGTEGTGGVTTPAPTPSSVDTSTAAPEPVSTTTHDAALANANVDRKLLGQDVFRHGVVGYGVVGDEDRGRRYRVGER
jgi:hypothetical protein